MPKRTGRSVSVDGLISELRDLDAKREDLARRIQITVSSVMSGESPLPWRKRRPGRPAGSAKKAAKRGRPKGRKMSAAARKAISDAQKKRWAKQKAGK